MTRSYKVDTKSKNVDFQGNFMKIKAILLWLLVNREHLLETSDDDDIC